jgi:hypothetical protein
VRRPKIGVESYYLEADRRNLVKLLSDFTSLLTERYPYVGIN